MKLEKPDGEEEEEINPFTREERDRIIAAFQANRYYKGYAPLVEFLFFTGCRPSEALALQWKNVKQQVITFRRVLIYDGKKLVIQDKLKTQALRKFSINPQLAEIIAAIKPENSDPESLVFPSPKGKFIDWSNFTTRAWAKILASLAQDTVLSNGEILPGIEYRNPYQMRHTFCSLCREGDIASIQLAKWVGNSAEMIDRVYAKPVNRISVPIL
ncbi:site-specific integrase [Egbenema bharatensis]|uniref:site-specific integrase n=1 Tax=Egbenema bharatensis TaxID=3463334 RepID=UPI003A859B7C